MKKMYILLVLTAVVFIAINVQSQDEQKKAEKAKTAMNHEKCESDEKSCSGEEMKSCCGAKEAKVSEVQPWNKVCPVKGGKVTSTTNTVNYEGKDYGFCCPGCDTKFQKDPAKYSKNLSKDGKEFIAKK